MLTNLKGLLVPRPFKLFYFVQDISLLAKARSLVEKFIDNAEHTVYEKLEQVDTSIECGIFIIDKELDFFQENLCDQGQENILIVVNDILTDLENYPYEIYISTNKVITSLSTLLYDLKHCEDSHSDYFCVDINSIEINTATPCDLYLKINDDRFLKVIKKNDVFDEEQLAHFQKKSKYLWVSRQHFFLFGDFLYGRDDLERQVNTPFSVESEDHLALIHDMAKSCGISVKTINSVSRAIENLQKNADVKLRSLFDKFNELKGSFLYGHSHFTALLAIEIASKMKWYRPQHLDKLVMAAILHDMGYHNKDNALYEALPKSKIEVLDPDERDDTLNHVTRIIQLIEGNNAIDSDIINIIKGHHGARGDESYPTKSFGSEMDLLTGIFLLTHTFTVSFFKVNFNKAKVQKILAYIKFLYDKGNLKKVIPDFETQITELMK